MLPNSHRHPTRMQRTRNTKSAITLTHAESGSEQTETIQQNQTESEIRSKQVAMKETQQDWKCDAE